MIYEVANSGDPIQQGDIFHDIPWVNFDPSNFSFIQQKQSADSQEKLPEMENMDWSSFLSQGDNIVNAIVQIRKADAIVITQNCDADHNEYISLAIINPFLKLSNKEKPPQTAGNWADKIRRQVRKEQDIFYLPMDTNIGFTERMAVNFESMIQLPRSSLQNLIHLRKGRLIPIANEHFRESLAQYFRRYPYNEWYPFTKEEYEAYKVKYPDAEPYDWQK